MVSQLIITTKKCDFSKTKVPYHGHVVSRQGVRANLREVITIRIILNTSQSATVAKPNTTQKAPKILKKILLESRLTVPRFRKNI